MGSCGCKLMRGSNTLESNWNDIDINVLHPPVRKVISLYSNGEARTVKEVKEELLKGAGIDDAENYSLLVSNGHKKKKLLDNNHLVYYKDYLKSEGDDCRLELHKNSN